MGCGCAGRMRNILRQTGYTLADDEWSKGDHVIPNSRIEEDHFRVLIETMEKSVFAEKARLFTRRLLGSQ